MTLNALCDRISNDYLNTSLSYGVSKDTPDSGSWQHLSAAGRPGVFSSPQY